MHLLGRQSATGDRKEMGASWKLAPRFFPNALRPPLVTEHLEFLLDFRLAALISRIWAGRLNRLLVRFSGVISFAQGQMHIAQVVQNFDLRLFRVLGCPQ